jgi:ribose 5-phosphate isomerase RpiB
MQTNCVLSFGCPIILIYVQKFRLRWAIIMELDTKLQVEASNVSKQDHEKKVTYALILNKVVKYVKKTMSYPNIVLGSCTGFCTIAATESIHHRH